MLYTFIGMFIGGWIAYFLAKINRVNFNNRGSFGGPSSGTLCVAAGVILGGATGFGMGVTLFATGSYTQPIYGLGRKIMA